MVTESTSIKIYIPFKKLEYLKLSKQFTTEWSRIKFSALMVIALYSNYLYPLRFPINENYQNVEKIESERTAIERPSRSTDSS